MCIAIGVAIILLISFGCIIALMIYIEGASAIVAEAPKANVETAIGYGGVFLDSRLEPTEGQSAFLKRQYLSLDLIEIPKRNA